MAGPRSAQPGPDALAALERVLKPEPVGLLGWR